MTKKEFLDYWHQRLHISIADKEAIYDESIKENVNPDDVVRYALSNQFSIRNSADYLVSFYKMGADAWYNKIEKESMERLKERGHHK